MGGLTKFTSEKDFKSCLTNRFENIFGKKPESTYIDEIILQIKKTKEAVKPALNEKWDASDIIMITYGDSLIDIDEQPLQTLNRFAKKYLSKVVSTIHILPFFPYSSDDGFSVIDYKKVNPTLGEWSDVDALAQRFKLMFDLVVNHISQFSEWFQNYKKGENPGRGYFIEADPAADLSAVVRPRSLPLLTPVETTSGLKHVWTTFSADQIDLNFANKDLVKEMINIFLIYLEKGASIIRLDAIAFLWKEIGTNCLHLPQTHEFVKLLRDIIDYIHPSLVLLTETNVPNKENLSYFGNNDEANMVYQFSLPPLLLHALYNGNSTYLTEWAQSIPELPDECTFFNFTASHDGIGVRPLEGLVPKKEFDSLVQGMRQMGAHISTKRNSDGSDSPYEMNITYLDALRATKKGFDTCQVERFICSQTIMMSLQGVPAFYIHSLLGTRNYNEGVKKTGMPRTINRKKWNANELFPLLKANTSQRRIFDEIRRRIEIRKRIGYFHPNTKQEFIAFRDDLIVFYRGLNSELLCLANITELPKSININDIPGEGSFNYDLIGETRLVSNSDELIFKPYQVMWLIEQE